MRPRAAELRVGHGARSCPECGVINYLLITVATLGCIQQCHEIGRRCGVELVTQLDAVGVKRPAGLRQVPFDQVRLDRHPLGALAEWLGVDGEQGDLDGFGVPGAHREVTAQRLEAVQHPEAETFAFG